MSLWNVHKENLKTQLLIDYLLMKIKYTLSISHFFNSDAFQNTMNLKFRYGDK